MPAQELALVFRWDLVTQLACRYAWLHLRGSVAFKQTFAPFSDRLTRLTSAFCCFPRFAEGKEADLAIAPLTVTVERETVVDFSKPFLSFDIKPSLKHAAKEAGAIFSFLDPLSTEVWLCLVFSIFAVTIVLFIVSRFSPYEWRVISYTDTQSSEHSEVATTKTTVVNEFSFWNSMWFSVGSFMQQGSDITPRSMSGRIVGTVWWFFTFIVISSYTASLASYLTLQRIAEPSQAYSKVAACPEDTSEGMRNIAIPRNQHGWLGFLLDRSSAEDNANKPCEMLVTVAHSGVKDFAVALQKGSELRDGVNLALQSLKDDGELQKLIRKWFTKAECDLNEQDLHVSELTLSQVAGLFYVLVGGLSLALGVALVEFCQHGRAEAARANVPLRAALTAKARLASRGDHKPHAHPHPRATLSATTTASAGTAELMLAALAHGQGATRLARRPQAARAPAPRAPRSARPRPPRLERRSLCWQRSLTAKARLASRGDHKPHAHPHPARHAQRDHDRLGWNGGAYAGRSLTAKARLASRGDHKPHAHPHPARHAQRDHDRLGWNGGAYAGRSLTAKARLATRGNHKPHAHPHPARHTIATVGTGELMLATTRLPPRSGKKRRRYTPVSRKCDPRPGTREPRDARPTPSRPPAALTFTSCRRRPSPGNTVLIRV
ncbi:hypothetical protein MSG28_001094 [Choristoneura fumiferana]|uniref:Uncharacterized protein n=1 Tax=Choristoneura fumiferana TaxID=7141 RepID=A0ACC0K3T1_CHOFU|nr:hypothetical protein MSG28_001094 [Choristoneura fumiferana]